MTSRICGTRGYREPVTVRNPPAFSIPSWNERYLSPNYWSRGRATYPTGGSSGWGVS